MAISKAEPGKTRVGWIGTGVMGRWMCQHLMNKGYKATVYNRTKDKAGPLLDAGAAWGATPKAVAEASDAGPHPGADRELLAAFERVELLRVDDGPAVPPEGDQPRGPLP